MGKFNDTAKVLTFFLLKFFNKIVSVFKLGFIFFKTTHPFRIKREIPKKNEYRTTVLLKIDKVFMPNVKTVLIE
tara:strand:- start:1782 stop:2003 length:222 start_codon:yes stop_codon:yes gene_type:complete